MKFRYKHSIFFLFLVIWASWLGAQTPVATSASATEMYDQGKKRVATHPDSARWYLRQAFKQSLSEEASTLPARSSRQMGSAFVQDAQFDSARHWYERSLFLRKDNKSKAYVWHDLSALFQRQGNYEEAFHYLSQVVVEREQNGNADQKGRAYHDLGLLCRNWGQKQRRLQPNLTGPHAKDSLALYNYDKSLAIWEKVGNDELAAYTLASRVPVLLDLGQSAVAMESAVRCQELYAQLEKRDGLARGFFMEGRVHQTEKRLGVAAERYQTALKIQEKGKNHTALIWTLNNLAMVYIEQTQYRQAEPHIVRAKQLLDSLSLRTEQTVEVYDTWAQYLQGREQYRAYLDALNAYHHLKDSLVYDLSGITSMESKLKEQRLKDGLKLAEQEQYYERLLFLGFLSFLVGGIVVWFYIQKQKRKQEKQQFQEEVLLRLGSLENEMYAKHADEQEALLEKVGREVHDNIGGKLTVFLRQMENFADSFSNWTQEQQQFFQNTEETLKMIYDTARNISHELDGTAFQEKDLITYLQQLKESLSDAGLAVSLHFNGLELYTFSQTVKYTLARICQEAVANIVKHADAQQVVIQLMYNEQEQELMLTIEDDGNGFEVETSTPGIGLSSMNTRIKQLEGRITIDSKPGRGTTLFAFIPT